MFETVLSKAAALKITYGWFFLAINHVHWHVEVVTGREGGIQTCVFHTDYSGYCDIDL